ncbi:hypothetical protein B6U74_03215 [Candidatus Bathyarchaeota archaeon ex4484_205]|nr:MAG: hypothetical protein B6U74_03215 [Candidatus Bathyarchaeota archaeon ex4484_205]
MLFISCNSRWEDIFFFRTIMAVMIQGSETYNISSEAEGEPTIPMSLKVHSNLLLILKRGTINLIHSGDSLTSL